jgi:hypothetical protein
MALLLKEQIVIFENEVREGFREEEFVNSINVLVQSLENGGPELPALRFSSLLLIRP